MSLIFDNNEEDLREKVFVLGLYLRKEESINSYLEELILLVKTLNLNVVGNDFFVLDKVNAKFLLGSGNVEKISNVCKALNATSLIIDYDLSPAQQRNWEKATSIKVLDRREVILDIFAKRARSKEAKLQVELAKMRYELPRLKRAWTHLDRQIGVMGIRGEGEKQIEIDKRLLRKRIFKLQKRLEIFQKNRKTQRSRRKKNEVVQIALIGYTNAGKSSIFNKLSPSAHAYTHDGVFSSLDTMSRTCEISHTKEIILTDTVGFVQKLPHLLVESFKATLEEAQTADIFLHIVDSSDPHLKSKMQTTSNVLSEINLETKTSILILNKTDLITENQLKILKANYPDAIFLCAKKEDDIKKLKKRLEEEIEKKESVLSLKIPLDQQKIVSQIYELGKMINISYQDDAIYCEVIISKKNLPQFEAYIINSKK